MKILYATIYHSEEKRAHIYSERYIMRYGAGTLWELWDWSVGLPTFGCLPSLMGTCGDFLFNNPSTISRCPVWKCLVNGNAIKINSSTNLTHFFHIWKLVVILTLQLKLQIKLMSINCVIALRRKPLTNVDAKSTVVRVMAWCRLATRHYLGKCCPDTVYPKKYAHGYCFAVLCCGYTLTDFPISIRLTSLALWQSNDCPSASKATLIYMDKYFMWIHYERLHNHNKAKHNKTVCIFLGIYCICRHMASLGHDG